MDRKIIRTLWKQISARRGRADALAKKAEAIAHLERSAEGGRVALVEGGRDCDGAQWEGRVTIMPALYYAIEREVESRCKWADGPLWFDVMKPSEAAEVEPIRRDLALEAFENGHPHHLIGAAA